MWKLTVDSPRRQQRPQRTSRSCSRRLASGADHSGRGANHRCHGPVSGAQRHRSPPRRGKERCRRDARFDRFTRATAHINLEGLVLDREVRDLRDQFVTSNYAKVPYNKSLKESIMASTRTMSTNRSGAACTEQGHHHVLGRGSETEIFDGSLDRPPSSYSLLRRATITARCEPELHGRESRRCHSRLRIRRESPSRAPSSWSRVGSGDVTM